MSSLAILQRDDLPSQLELQLQSRLNCELICRDSGAFGFLLRYRSRGLTLSSTRAGAPGGLCVDFGSSALRRRRQQGLKRQDLGRAVGLKKSTDQTILDATSGLGSDAFLLASAGCRLILLERSAVVAELLEDGLVRARQAGGELAEIAARMQLRQGDFLAIDDLPAADVVYLDPMFPRDRKTAKSRKDMALLQELLGEAEDSPAMLDRARALASRRVVVKRAKHSATMGSAKPDIQFRGSSSRYDVYLCPKQEQRLKATS